MDHICKLQLHQTTGPVKLNSRRTKVKVDEMRLHRDHERDLASKNWWGVLQSFHGVGMRLLKICFRDLDIPVGTLSCALSESLDRSEYQKFPACCSVKLQLQLLLQKCGKTDGIGLSICDIWASVFLKLGKPMLKQAASTSLQICTLKDSVRTNEKRVQISGTTTFWY